jgi:multiple sugar transport system permease protein
MSTLSARLPRIPRLSPYARREAIVFYLCISPWIIGFLVFLAYPVFRSLYLAFTRYQIGHAPVWIGFNNFNTLAHDRLFWKSLSVTTEFVLGSVPGSNLIALGIAMLLAQKIRGIGIWRTIYFLPSVVSLVAISVLWYFVFNPQYGIVNTFLDYLGIKGPGWYTSETWAMPTIILISWWMVGTQIIIYLAGLKGIPQEYYEAVEVDGGGPWSKFRHITIPLLSPVIFFNLVNGFIGAFQVFDQAWILSAGSGRPNNATLTYMLNLYKQAFEFGSMGYASALAWVLFIIIMAFTVLILRSSSFWVYYEAERK